ncbi:hypothetical protein B0H12DRAFT_1073129 [Mycena haematopus]|nr:hypothetical protein B0H12DRAFT_1078658 [Mycena haematopus]KAJ7246845.1 hypothetical protein B0H12DRAFT_1073129 [Mycena haematopus]
MAGELWILRVRITEEKHTLSERTLSGLHMWLKVPGMRDEPTADDPDERRIWNWEHFAEADSAYNTRYAACATGTTRQRKIIMTGEAVGCVRLGIAEEGRASTDRDAGGKKQPR